MTTWSLPFTFRDQNFIRISQVPHSVKTLCSYFLITTEIIFIAVSGEGNKLEAMYFIKDFGFLGPSRFSRNSELCRVVVPWVFSDLIPEDDGRVLLQSMGTRQSGRSTVSPSYVIIGLTSATVNFSSVEPK